jgi:hypothetical protein
VAAWNVRFFQRHVADDPERQIPADDFLQNVCSRSIRARFYAILTSVANGPPPKFRGGSMWRAMHGDMGGYYETRVLGPQKRLHRLFCFLEQPRPGLDAPTVVVICGMVKANETAFTKADYDYVRQLGEEFRRHNPSEVLA